LDIGDSAILVILDAEDAGSTVVADALLYGGLGSFTGHAVGAPQAVRTQRNSDGETHLECTPIRV
jgi:hypothetical protein